MADRHTALPTGTVTFLFTDIEGSTRLLSERGEGYADLLSEHRRALRQAFQRHGGVEVDSQGDAFFYAFASAKAAARAATEAQAALARGPIRVRMGLHTGEPVVTDEGYVGIDVHRAARIMAAGHGGQVLVSQATRELLDGDLTDLGEHRLKDLTAPSRLWQLGPGDFPPPRTLYRTNLPVQAAPLVGRERELAEAGVLLRRHRLLTLSGPGGSGKTRLALQVAAEGVEGFADGVWWVPLAAITDPQLVLPAVARMLGTPGDVAVYLSSKRLLLLLDNLEQVIDCAPQLADLLASAAEVHILVTSRELLRIDGEHEYAVEPMVEDEAVTLFTERAVVAEPREAVLEICRLLDCLPLAVELAAARTAVLPPTQLLARLDDRLGLLTGGRRDAPARQRTLRATIEWSHELLTPQEQALFRNLGVFGGGFTLEAAEAVSGADLDTLQALVGQSLVRRSASGRFGLLETIREFARDRLDDHPDAARLHAAHAKYYLELAEAADPETRGARQSQRLEELEQEHPNLREALAWALNHDRADMALRLAAALTTFWMYHSHLSESRHWLADALEADRRAVGRAPAEMDLLRANALAGASVLATLQADWAMAETYGIERLEIARRLNDGVQIANSLLSLGRPALARGDPDGARVVLSEAVESAREAGEPWTIAMGTFNLAYVSLSVRDFPRARAEMELALEQFRPLADQYGTARSLTGLGAIAVHSDDTDAAIAPLRESLTILLALGDREGPAWALELMGDALAPTDPEASARLLGAADGLRQDLGISLTDAEVEPHERAVARIDGALEGDALSAAWTAGRRLTLPDAVAFALGRTVGRGRI
jgi:predicted ATPase/class 3 adenylate cyclase